jgi:hypothetical protein
VQYKNGKHIPSVWRPNIDLVTAGWINRCCATGEYVPCPVLLLPLMRNMQTLTRRALVMMTHSPDFMLGENSKLHYALLVSGCPWLCPLRGLVCGRDSTSRLLLLFCVLFGETG